MAGANYMGGKRNAAKARTKDSAGRLQKGFFSKKRLEILTDSLGNFRRTISSHKTRNIQGLRSEIDFTHAKRVLPREEGVRLHTYTEPTLYTPRPKKTHQSDSTLSSGSRRSKVLEALHKTDPLFIRADVDDILGMPNLVGLRHRTSSVSALSRSSKRKRPSAGSEDGTGQSKKQRRNSFEASTFATPLKPNIINRPDPLPQTTGSHLRIANGWNTNWYLEPVNVEDFESMELDDSTTEDSGYWEPEDRHRHLSPQQSPFSPMHKQDDSILNFDSSLPSSLKNVEDYSKAQSPAPRPCTADIECSVFASSPNAECVNGAHHVPQSTGPSRHIAHDKFALSMTKSRTQATVSSSDFSYEYVSPSKSSSALLVSSDVSSNRPLRLPLAEITGRADGIGYSTTRQDPSDRLPFGNHRPEPFVPKSSSPALASARQPLENMTHSKHRFSAPSSDNQAEEELLGTGSGIHLLDEPDPWATLGRLLNLEPTAGTESQQIQEPKTYNRSGVGYTQNRQLDESSAARRGLEGESLRKYSYPQENLSDDVSHSLGGENGREGGVEGDFFTVGAHEKTSFDWSVGPHAYSSASRISYDFPLQNAKLETEGDVHLEQTSAELFRDCIQWPESEEEDDELPYIPQVEAAASNANLDMLPSSNDDQVVTQFSKHIPPDYPISDAASEPTKYQDVEPRQRESLPEDVNGRKPRPSSGAQAEDTAQVMEATPIQSIPVSFVVRCDTPPRIEWYPQRQPNPQPPYVRHPNSVSFTPLSEVVKVAVNDDHVDGIYQGPCLFPDNTDDEEE